MEGKVRKGGAVVLVGCRDGLGRPSVVVVGCREGEASLGSERRRTGHGSRMEEEQGTDTINHTQST